MKYLRLLRLQDHFIIFGGAISAGNFLRIRNWDIFLWGIAIVSISICAFILNELVDSDDCDKYSWNKIHMKRDERYDPLIVKTMFIIFSFLAAYLSYINGLLFWAAIIYTVSILYSLKPFRLKTRFSLDMLSQLFSVTMPVLAIGWKYGLLEKTIPFAIVLLGIGWSIILPYQLADFHADKKAGFKSTHVIIGMKNSIILGFVFAMVGMTLFFLWDFQTTIPWAFIFVLLSLYSCFRYFQWYKMENLSRQARSMQEYVKIVKPIGYLIVPYLLLIWMLV